jgi:predicted ATP-grasp superfamily ATP-dependent carboligase
MGHTVGADVTPGRNHLQQGLTALGLGLVGYTYAAYPLVVAALARGRSAAPLGAGVTADGGLPTMTVVIPAFDEAAIIEWKVADTLRQDYPRAKLQVLVVADGSTDETAEKAMAAGAEVLWQPQRNGKSAAVNRGVAGAAGDVVCLTDANCRLEPGTLRALAARFADPSVAVVSGAKHVSGDGAKGQGEGMYWRLESWVKRSESAFGCTMGAPGEVCALRRADFRPIPGGVINDDYYLVCDALSRGRQVQYEPGAVAREDISPTILDEWERRTRIGAGSWQVTLRFLQLAHPRHRWAAWAFISHRVLRNVVVPPLLPALWVLSGPLARSSRFGRMLFTAQTAFYSAAALGAVRDERLLAIPFQFAFTNAATARGGWRHLRRSQPAAWRKQERAPITAASQHAAPGGSAEATRVAGPRAHAPAVVLASSFAGLAVVRSLGRRGVPVVAALSDPHDFAGRSRHAERWLVPDAEQEPGRLLDLLMSRGDEASRPVLVPTSDAALVFTARHHDELSSRYRVACMPWTRVRDLIDKRYTYATAAALGVPVPRTGVPVDWEEAKGFADEIGYPCLVKPCEGHRYYAAFGRKMRKVEDRQALEAAYLEARTAGLDVMIQEFIPGTDSHGANYVAYASGGEVLVDFTSAKRRLSPTEIGFPCAVVSRRLPDVAAAGRHLLSEMGIEGFACTEFKLDPRDRRYKLMEVNARHNMSGQLAVSAGVDFPWLMYRHLVHGVRPEPTAWREDVHWVNTSAYLRGAPTAISGRQAWAPFVEPLRHRVVEASFSLSDPVPFAARTLGLIDRRHPGQPTPTGSESGRAARRS